MSAFAGFGSDNHSGVHPDILNALQDVNDGYVVAYGNDDYTKKAIKQLKEMFGKQTAVFFVYNGTATNILGLRNVTDSYHSILCAESAHLTVHECCGPENYIGCKLVTIPTKDGKLRVDQIEPYIMGVGDPHMAQPHVISLTQATERGTVYREKEIQKLADFAHDHGMLLHMDGARLCNAAAFLKIGLNDICGKVGVDVLSFGGTKNGMMYGEAVVFFDKNLAKNFEFIRKQGMQLTSKMRYISAQFSAFLSNELWLRNAVHANEMAQLLAKHLRRIPGVQITQKVEANMVYAIIPNRCIMRLQKQYYFHRFNERTCEVRLMCSFTTQREDVLLFAEALQKAIRDEN
ncbi:MAG: aminotransferase class V-fold PLP-dependent enzyme [Candidatus Thermoplasmatota archaeon]|nr:aminotransferase class V-fold PLP-dependent enzyme [Candidatus Thermoplasmatota archaeon]